MAKKLGVTYADYLKSKAAKEVKPTGPDLKNYKKPAGPAVDRCAKDKQWPACQEGRHQFNGKSFCGRCGEPKPKDVPVGDRRSRLHAALDAVMTYSKPPVIRKTLSILNPNDLAKMTGSSEPQSIGKGKPYTGFAKDSMGVCPVCKTQAPVVRGVFARHWVDGAVCSGSGSTQAKDGVDPARYAAEVVKRRTELNGKSTQELRQIAQQGSRLDYGGFKNVDKQSLVWHILSNSYGDKTLGEIYDYLNKAKAKDAGDAHIGKGKPYTGFAKDENPQEKARRKLSPEQAARLKELLAKVKPTPSAAAPMPRAKDDLPNRPGAATMMSNKCLRCNGTGRVMISGRNPPCPECNGTGKSKRSYAVHGSADEKKADTGYSKLAKDSSDFEVKKGRSGNWALFKPGSDYPESNWFLSKAKAAEELKRRGGKVSSKKEPAKEPDIFGYPWEYIQAMQRGDRLGAKKILLKRNSLDSDLQPV